MGARIGLSIPNGWFQIAYADELVPGGDCTHRYFDQALRLRRSEAGKLELDGSRGPGGSTSLPCVERNQMIWAWHHAHGEPPTWEVPEVPELHDPAWTQLERHRWRVRSHPQEMGENGVDRAHFRYVHGTQNVPESTLELEGHVRRAAQQVRMRTPRGEVDGKIAVEAHGLGCTITRFTGICETVLVLSHTPIDAETVDTRFAFSQREADAGSGVAAAVVREVVRQMNQDIPIWEHKRYLAAPMLCDGDGPIAEYRRWARQFSA